MVEIKLNNLDSAIEEFATLNMRKWGKRRITIILTEFEKYLVKKYQDRSSMQENIDSKQDQDNENDRKDLIKTLEEKIRKLKID